MMPRSLLTPLAALAVAATMASLCLAEYKDTTPRKPAEGEIEVAAPGSFAQAGKTYVLTQDIDGPMTPVFLGKDVTLDLNGHTHHLRGRQVRTRPQLRFRGWLGRTGT